MIQQKSDGDIERWLSPKKEIVVYIALLVLTSVMRFWDLGSRSMHHDESLHALYSWYIFQGMGYQHDPMMHGPFQYFGNALVFSLLGDSELTARVLYVLFGVALVGLPWFLRSIIGRTGAVTASVLLALSPTLIYFSRFARNDIIMAVWMMGIVICVWQYLDQRKERYLYGLAGFLSLALATKEVIYLSIIPIGLFLLVLTLTHMRRYGWRFHNLPVAGDVLIVLITLTLPQLAPMISLVQGPLGLVLANPDPTIGEIGMPLGLGIPVAIVSTGTLAVISILIGLLWNWRRWLLLAGIFYGIWAVLFSSLFSYPFGLVTGVWQGLGYWIVQQDVGRGDQPWYYYFVVGSVYEFLPFFFAAIGVVKNSVTGDLFGKFLVLWVIVNTLLFMVATEKMPWLLVHIALPMILMTGRVLGDFVVTVEWTKMVRNGTAVSVALGLPLFLYLSYQILFLPPHERIFDSFIILGGWFLILCGASGLFGYSVYKHQISDMLVVVGLVFAAILMVFEVHSGLRLTYRNDDTPIEMLVYTQTSPDVPRIAQDVRSIADKSGLGQELPITIDIHSGFAWPWAWYFRGFDAISFVDYGKPISPPIPRSGIVIINADNREAVGPDLEREFLKVEKFRHRWWFPEMYRGIDFRALGSTFLQASTWQSLSDYWFHREFATPIGSQDGYFYYSSSLGIEAHGMLPE